MTLNRRWRFGDQEPTKPGGVGLRQGPSLLCVEVMPRPGISKPFRQRPTGHNHCAEVLEALDRIDMYLTEAIHIWV